MNNEKMKQQSYKLSEVVSHVDLIQRSLDSLEYARKNDQLSYEYQTESGLLTSLVENLLIVKDALQVVADDLIPDDEEASNHE